MKQVRKQPRSRRDLGKCFEQRRPRKTVLHEMSCNGSLMVEASPAMTGEI
jgi:hypothetical protein